MRRRLGKRWWVRGLLFFILVLVVTALVVGVQMANLDVKVEFYRTYAVPELPKIGELLEMEQGQWAVAVDGVVVAQGGETTPQPTASTAKMILALAVMEKKPFNVGEKGEVMKLGVRDFQNYSRQIAQGGSRTEVQVGKEISEYDALVTLLLASSNNMADSLAEWVFGSQEEYAKYAGEMLARMGVSGVTIGKDASGFDESTVAMAADLAMVAREVLRQPVLAEIVGLKEAEVPMAGKVVNTNKLLGEHGIVGVKTGWIGEPSGYCLASGYLQDGHIITVVVLGAESRQESFDKSRQVVLKMQERLVPTVLVKEEEEVAYYEAWWIGKQPVVAAESVSGLGWDGAEVKSEINGDELKIGWAGQEYIARLSASEFASEPSLWQRFLRVFGWAAE